MERLTEKVNGEWQTNCKADIGYIDTNESIFVGNAIDKLAEFEDFIEEQGFKDLQSLKDTLYQTNMELYSMIKLQKENQLLKGRWEKLKKLLEEDMEHNSKEYDESFCSAFNHYSATENWILDRMQELEKE